MKRGSNSVIGNGLTYSKKTRLMVNRQTYTKTNWRNKGKLIIDYSQ